MAVSVSIDKPIGPVAGGNVIITGRATPASTVRVTIVPVATADPPQASGLITADGAGAWSAFFGGLGAGVRWGVLATANATGVHDSDSQEFMS